MVSVKIPKTPARWYAQDDKARLKLESMGVPRIKIYEAKKGETWDKFKMRKGEALGVVGGLRAFGGKIDIRQAIDHFHGHGAFILDCETGQDTLRLQAAMIKAATTLRRYTAEEKEARATARNDARRKANGAMLTRDAYTEWHKKDGRTADEKAEHIGWPRSSLYAEFGASGAPAGRRPKQPKD